MKLITFETAKLAKKKGFNNVNAYQYKLMDWLRENKLFIFISINDTIEYENIVSYKYTIIQNSKGSSYDYTICSKKDYEDYNECLEEALQEALKLI